MSIFNKTGLVRHAAVVFLVWTLSLPAAEVIFRLMGDRPSDDLAGLYVPFGDGSYKLRPMVDTEANWSAGKFSVHTDSLGLRCDSQRCMAVKQGEGVDVMFLGDSQGYGNGVSYEESLCGWVARFGLGEGLRVANACIGGHSARNQLEMAKWLKDEHGVAASKYILLATPLMVHYPQSYTRAKVGADGRLYDTSEGAAAHSRLWLKTHLVIYDRVRDAARNLGLGARPQQDRQVLELYGGASSEAAACSNFVALLSEFSAFAKKQGAEFDVVYVPLTAEADFAGIQQMATAQGMKVDPNLPGRICAAAAGTLGLRFYDLKPVLKELHDQGDPLRLKGDFHYDRNLSKACATSVYGQLRGPWLMAAGKTPSK